MSGACFISGAVRSSQEYACSEILLTQLTTQPSNGQFVLFGARAVICGPFPQVRLFGCATLAVASRGTRCAGSVRSSLARCSLVRCSLSFKKWSASLISRCCLQAHRPLARFVRLTQSITQRIDCRSAEQCLIMKPFINLVRYTKHASVRCLHVCSLAKLKTMARYECSERRKRDDREREAAGRSMRGSVRGSARGSMRGSESESVHVNRTGGKIEPVRPAHSKCSEM